MSGVAGTLSVSLSLTLSLSLSLSLYLCPLMIFLISLCMFIGGLWSLWAEKKWRKMDIHARAAVWLVNFIDFFLSSIFVHWHTVRWSLYQGVYNDNLVTRLDIPQRCAAMYLLSTAKLLLHWAISISGWLAGPPLRLETVIVSKHITVATPSSLS